MNKRNFPSTFTFWAEPLINTGLLSQKVKVEGLYVEWWFFDDVIGLTISTLEGGNKQIEVLYIYIIGL